MASLTPSRRLLYLRKRSSLLVLLSILVFMIVFGVKNFAVLFHSIPVRRQIPLEPFRANELELAERIYQRNLERRKRAKEIPLLSIPAKFYWMAPLYPCFGEERLGNWGDGGKWICRVDDLRKRDTIVYSVGCNGDVSFERDVWHTLGVKTFTFDPTLAPRVEKNVQALDFIHFFKIGLTHEDNLKGALSRLKTAVRGSQMMRIEQMMSMMNHTYVDVFKVDCEGCEFKVMRRLHKERPRNQPLFGQILMEIHEFGKHPSKVHLMQMMEEMGYRLFHTEPNYYCRACFELAYIHENLLLP